MATYSAVCVDGTFSQVNTISGNVIRCSGTLENREFSPVMDDLTQSEISEISAAVLLFFSICFVVKFIRQFLTDSTPSRGG
jgi:hypothetical protein